MKKRKASKKRSRQSKKVKVDKTTMVAMLINQMSQALMEGDTANAVTLVSKIKRMACRAKKMDIEWYDRIKNGLRRSKVYALIHNDEVTFREILNLERELEKRMHTTF